MRNVGKVFLGVLLGSLAITSTGNAGWSGENGVIRFSFTDGPDLVSVTEMDAGENGVTLVHLYAWLTDVVPLVKDGDAFQGIAAFEIPLIIEGAEGFVIKQDLPPKCISLGQTLGHCIVGLDSGLTLKDGAVQLVHWQIMFPGRPENVVFRLDSTDLFNCPRTPGCVGSGVSALYSGIESPQFQGDTFGAGYQPAYLNYSGEPDLQDVHGTVSWEDFEELQRR